MELAHLDSPFSSVAAARRARAMRAFDRGRVDTRVRFSCGRDARNRLERLGWGWGRGVNVRRINLDFLVRWSICVDGCQRTAH